MSEKDAKEPISQWIDSYQNNKNALLLDRIVHRLLPIVNNIASRFVKDQNLYEDIRQVASIGMLKAINKYDISKGTNFYSYLTPMVIGEIKHFYRDNDWLINVPRGIKETNTKIRKIVPYLMQKYKRVPTTLELARELNLSVDDVVEAINLSNYYQLASLEDPVRLKDNSQGMIELGHTIGVNDDRLMELEELSELEELFSHLSSLEKKLVKLRYIEKLTQKEIADILGISQMQVSRLLKDLRNKLYVIKQSLM
jgi:RNA polymerase sigma-B factor